MMIFIGKTVNGERGWTIRLLLGVRLRLRLLRVQDRVF
jgi:hypothetical protein